VKFGKYCVLQIHSLKTVRQRNFYFLRLRRLLTTTIMKSNVFHTFGVTSLRSWCSWALDIPDRRQKSD